MSFKGNTYQELWRPLSSAQQTICARAVEDHFCEIISNLDKWFWRRCLLRIYLIKRSRGPFVRRGGGGSNLCNFGRMLVLTKSQSKKLEKNK